MADLEVRPRANDEADEPDLNLSAIWTTVMRNRWLVAACTAAVLAVSVLMALRAMPVYEAEATLSISDDGGAKNPLADLVPSGGGGQGKLETEMLVLRSRQIAEQVVDSLDLSVRLMEPARPRDEVLRLLTVPRDARRGAYLLTRTGDAAYRVEAEGTTPAAGLPSSVRIGQPFQAGGATLAIAPGMRAKQPERIRFVVREFRAAVDTLRAATTVYRPDPKAQVLGIRYHDSDRRLASDVPNVAAAKFIRYQALASKAESRSTVEFLRAQVGSYQDELHSAEDQLKSFREQNQVLSPKDEATEQVKRMAELQARRDELRAERQSLAQLLDRVAHAGPRGPGEQSPYRQLASYPVFFSNKAVQDMLQSLNELENQRSTLLVQRTTANPDVQRIDSRMQEIELGLYQTARDYLAALDSQLASADANMSQFGVQGAALPQREVGFARLSRQQTLLGDLYTLLQTRLKEAEIQEASDPANIRVLDSALVPERPISPRPLRNGVLGLLLGLAAGVAAAFGREALDTKVRTQDDARLATRGRPILGVIPRFQHAAAALPSNGNGRAARALPAGVGQLVARSSPNSPASEAYRALRTNIAFTGAGRAPQLLVVTSAMPGEGKSTTSGNLAVTLAQQGSRTLLVDADLRRGTLHHLLDTPQEPGLTHVLIGRATLDEAVRTLTSAGGTSIDFMPSGAFPPQPAELLSSDAFRKMLAELRERYDTVIFDAPPLNLVTDAVLLARVADGTVLVARTGVTDKRALQHASAQLFQVRAPVAGVVLNDVDVEGSGKHYGYGAYGSYGSYGSRVPADAYSGNGNGNGKRHD
jgi:tyrosine-protein kinase Etk/Wzc